MCKVNKLQIKLHESILPIGIEIIIYITMCSMIYRMTKKRTNPKKKTKKSIKRKKCFIINLKY